MNAEQRAPTAGVSAPVPGRRSWQVALMVFFISAAAAAVVIWFLEQERLQHLRNMVSAIASDHANGVAENIKRNMLLTRILAMQLRQGGGAMPDLEAFTREMLPNFRGLSAVTLAPEGIVRQIAPLAGNEAVIGLDLLKDPAP